MDYNFDKKVTNVLNLPEPSSIPNNILKEGMILNVNTIVANAIRVPEGDYIVAIIDSDRCVLIPTTEAGSQKKFEVFKPTLAGFFNPEIHKKVKELPDDNTIAEAES